MENKIYFDNLKSQYESLKEITLEDNTLKYTKDNLTYFVRLKIDLNNLPIAIFNLSPDQILNTIYIYQLFFQENLTDTETKLIKEYLKLYSDYATKKTTEPENFSEEVLFALSIPIYSAYDEKYINTLASKVIQNYYENINKEIENEFGQSDGKQMTKKLKLADMPNTEAYLDYEEFSQKLNTIQNAGFTTIFLIGFVVMATIVYLIIA